jgi:putative transposase
MAHDLITSPASIVIKAADVFQDKTSVPNQLWQREAKVADRWRLGGD